MNQKNWSSNYIVILSKFILGVVALAVLWMAPIYSCRLFFWTIDMPVPAGADKFLVWIIGVIVISISSCLIAFGAFLGHLLYEEICKKFF
jgi:hypothetical protein